MKRPDARKGDSLHRLVHTIEQAISGSPEVQVESPKRVPDKDTGKPREHDVVLTFRRHHHEIAVAIECRDRTRKIGVPEVEAFHAKCLRTGIDRGVMVSSLGFAGSAITKAASYNIGCLELKDVAQFDWCLVPVVEVLRRNVKHVDCGVIFDKAPPPDCPLHMSDGSPFPRDQVLGWACRVVDQYRPDNGVPEKSRGSSRTTIRQFMPSSMETKFPRPASISL